MGTPVTDTPSLLPAAQSFNVSRIITWTWGIIFALMTFTIVTIKRDGITLDPYSLIDPLGALGGLFGVMVYRHIHPVMVKNKFSIRLRWQKRHLPRAWYVVQLINQFAFGTHTIVILSYLGARLAFPLFDTQLSHIDQALSFDWYGFIGWVDRHPIIAKSLTFSYHSMNAEVILCIAIFAVLHHDAQLHRFVLQFLVSAFICVTIATLVPALGPYGFYHIEPSQYPNLKSV